jgi:selenide,water dikinase
MNVSPEPLTQTLVFIGGGHSHAIALKKWAMNPVPGVRLILITDVVHTPYSGMLPGYVAGLYTYDQCHIDLRPLCQLGQVQLVRDRAIGLDLETNTVICDTHPPIAFDYLSIDIGSTPSINQVPGAQQYAIPAKPISKFLDQWDALLKQVQHQNLERFRVGVVGGGAGGVELALSIRGRLQSICQAHNQALKDIEVHLFQRGHDLLPQRHPRMRRTIHQVMHNKQIRLHLGETVTAVTANDEAETSEYQVVCDSGLTVSCDRLFWVTQASAAPWLKESGIATDDQGFIQVNDYLQSTSHPNIFAAGDISLMVNHPRPKAGVFAVRQGAPLFENLQRATLKQPLKAFHPQKEFLILVGTGDERAIASRGCVTLGPCRWLWRWKDRIDRAFMDKFTQLDAAMESSSGTKQRPLPSSPATHTPLPSSHRTEPSSVASTMHCAGCASKVGRSVLERVLHRLQQECPDAFQHPDILLGLTAPDDAAAISIHHPTTLVQTLDYFRALVDDPFIFGQIAANHCLSDLFAMGATPHSVLAIANLPYATEAIHEETLYHLLSGALNVLHQAGAVLVGGHTTEGNDLALGFSCNGFQTAKTLLKKSGMQAGDRLILTKALGTGTLFAANMQFKAKGRWIEGAIASMLQSNQTASHILQAHHATACTDVTGFGLLGHLLEMVRPGSANRILLNLTALPILDGAEDTTRQRLLSSLHPQNAHAFAQVQQASAIANHPLAPLLVDPQTSGGLLATLPAEHAEACVAGLHQAGYVQARVIGTVVEAETSVNIEHPPVQVIL